MRIILNPGLFYFIVFTLVLSMGNTESARGQQRRLDLQFEILALPQGGTSNEVRQVYQDCEGFIWIATNSGFGMTDMILSLINRTCITETY